MYNEPPKIFAFSEFSLNWIKGHLDRDVTLNPRHDDEYDLDMHRINAMGYLIDHLENVVDAFGGNILFKKEILQNKYGQESEIPYIYRSGKLRTPENDEIEKELERKHERAMAFGKRDFLGGMNDSDMMGSGEDVLYELDRLDKPFGLMDDGNLAALHDDAG